LLVSSSVRNKELGVLGSTRWGGPRPRPNEVPPNRLPSPARCPMVVVVVVEVVVGWPRRVRRKLGALFGVS
jgi:hypothetical protein